MSPACRLVVSIDEQTLSVIEAETCVHTYPVSTAIKGMGFANGSFRTPTGAFRIVEAIGADQPNGTIFKARVPVGVWQRGDKANEDLVLTRILRLDGLDFANANTLERCIYIHGTNHEELIGQRAGHGCVRLRNDDIIELFNRVNVNDLVEIRPATQPSGSLLFVHLDHLLPPSDGKQMIDSIHSIGVFCENLRTLANRVCEFIIAAKVAGWCPVLLSNATADLAASISRSFEIDHYEVPTPKSNLDLITIIYDWRRSFLPSRAMFLGPLSIMHGLQTIVDDFVCAESLSPEEKSTLRAASRVIELNDVLSCRQLLESARPIPNADSNQITSYNLI